jgi:hypothetical protein
LATYKLNLYPYSDLIIYEIGAGNGTLMADILDFLAVEAPEVYARTKYRIIEISDRLVGKQKGSVAGGKRREQGGMSEGEMGREKARRRGHGDRVEVIGKSIFEWDRVVHEPCFFIAMEVLVSASLPLSAAVILERSSLHFVRTTLLTTLSGIRPTLTNPYNAQSRSTLQAITTNSILQSKTLSSLATSLFAPNSRRRHHPANLELSIRSSLPRLY